MSNVMYGKQGYQQSHSLVDVDEELEPGSKITSDSGHDTDSNGSGLSIIENSRQESEDLPGTRKEAYPSTCNSQLLRNQRQG